MDGEQGHYLGDTSDFDAVVLDLGLPGMNGIEVLRKWRDAGRSMPVLILTARDLWSDKVAGIDAAADDYLAKPSTWRSCWPASGRSSAAAPVAPTRC